MSYTKQKFETTISISSPDATTNIDIAHPINLKEADRPFIAELISGTLPFIHPNLTTGKVYTITYVNNGAAASVLTFPTPSTYTATAFMDAQIYHLEKLGAAAKFDAGASDPRLKYYGLVYFDESTSKTKIKINSATSSISISEDLSYLLGEDAGDAITHNTTANEFTSTSVARLVDNISECIVKIDGINFSQHSIINGEPSKIFHRQPISVGVGGTQIMSTGTGTSMRKSIAPGYINRLSISMEDVDGNPWQTQGYPWNLTLSIHN